MNNLTARRNNDDLTFEEIDDLQAELAEYQRDELRDRETEELYKERP